MKYHCENHKPIPKDCVHDAMEAAEMFAQRKARAEYGRRGRVAALRLDSWTPDGQSGIYEAFIGRKTGLHETTGHNVQFQMYISE